MPVITKQELKQMIPLFQSKGGSLLLDFAFKLVGMDKFNAAYDANAAHVGPDFAKALVQYEGADYYIGNSRVLEHLPEGAFIVIANHVYGGFDGVMLIDMIGGLRPDLKVMVNKLLTYLKSLCPSFIAVNPTGETRTAPTAQSLLGVKEALLTVRNGHPLGIFPSGAVSDLSVRDGFKIRDREWQEPAIRLIKKARVPILPIRFFDHNTLFYYLLGLISWKVRLLRLPREIINKGNTLIRLGLGEIIPPEKQDQYTDMKEFRSFLRSSVYDMPMPAEFVSRHQLY